MSVGEYIVLFWPILFEQYCFGSAEGKLSQEGGVYRNCDFGIVIKEPINLKMICLVVSYYSVLFFYENTLEFSD